MLARTKPLRVAVLFLLVAGTAPAQDDLHNPEPPMVFGTPQAQEDKFLFRLGDQGQCDRLVAGALDLDGKTAQLVYADRIVPHEKSVFVLLDGVESLTGKFSKIELPEGDLCDVDYDTAARRVTVKNFRPNRPPAFPGAEGFGKYTIGGRGGKVYAVTNLNDNGPGSFREGCEAASPRTIVFRVSGTIALEKKLKVKNPYLTIAGQTAPGDGICIKNYQFNFDTQHLIVRYMRFRPGDESAVEQDSYGGTGDHIITDHCSASWSIDETLSINKASNHTVQWCMVTESLYDSIHHKGKHGYGGLWGGAGGSFHHNILAHHSSRNPRASGNNQAGLLDMRDNVIYNWGFNSAYGGELWPRNWINNYYKSGPATGDKVRNRIFYQKDPRGKMYCDGNFVFGYPEITKDNWSGGVQFAPDGEASEKTLRLEAPCIVAPVTTDTAEAAYERVLKNAGASLRRDSLDSRIIEEIRTGTAKYGRSYGEGGKGIIDSQKDVGGWPELKSTEAPADTDGDGMPDSWEKEHALDPQNAADGAQDRGDGYTQLEGYLNSLVTL